MTDTLVVSVARKISATLAKNYADYLDECEQDRKNGHRAHYCEHGANMWTDWDNICGYCEESITMGDGVMRRAEALRIAHESVADWHAAVEALRTLERTGVIQRYTREYDALWKSACDVLGRHYS